MRNHEVFPIYTKINTDKLILSRIGWEMSNWNLIYSFEKPPEQQKGHLERIEMVPLYKVLIIVCPSL